MDWPRFAGTCYNRVQQHIGADDRSQPAEAIMTETLEVPFLELSESIPDELFLLHHPGTGKYGCYRHNGVHGLACFSTEAGAFRFAEWIDLTGMVCQQVNFESAREIAKSRPLPVVCLMVLDRMDEPVIHYVR